MYIWYQSMLNFWLFRYHPYQERFVKPPHPTHVIRESIGLPTGAPLRNTVINWSDPPLWNIVINWRHPSPPILDYVIYERPLIRKLSQSNLAKKNVTYKTYCRFEGAINTDKLPLKMRDWHMVPICERKQYSSSAFGHWIKNPVSCFLS